MQNQTSTMLPAAAPRSLVFLAIAICLVFAASLLGSSATGPQIPLWYAGLKKPWFNPPNWVFPVAWTFLFSLMAFGFWRILRHVEAGDLRRRAIIAFIVQLVFNVSWSFAFFAANSAGAGVAVAIGLVLTVAAMVLAWRKVDELAAWLQMPYLFWVTFALILNATIWRIN
jgi:translocator protein